VAEACRTGASTNIIFGLALGYQSCIVPTIVLAVIIYISFSLANMYGVACAALGMLGTLATGGLQHFVCMTFDRVHSIGQRTPRGRCNRCTTAFQLQCW
jgi:Inorganic H+ pyrophosphatase